MADNEPGQQHRRTMIVASGATFLAIAMMAWDHLWGNERGPADSFPVDPATFFISLALIVTAAVLVFGITVRRSAGHPATVDRSALIHSGIALALAIPLSWLGFPTVVAGAGVALGIQGLGGTHRRVAIAAIGVGLLVIVFAILGTAFPTADDD
jgi:hypothetical protein